MAACKLIQTRSNVPIIVILGSTATGKSKLGIELAKELNGEIISADSMQVYKGLNIITNKVTADEKLQATHHLIDIVSPPVEFSVVEFRKKALEIVSNLFSAKKIPIIVGGTNYYIESLLWNFLIDEVNEQSTGELQKRKDKRCNGRKRKSSDIEDNSTTTKFTLTNEKSLYDSLKMIDPERAEQLHPNNLRKISRSLQIYETSGKKHSDLLNEQKKQTGSSHLSGPLRFSKSLIFWLTCEQDVLNERISERVDSMLLKGLSQEVSEFYQQYKQSKFVSMGTVEDATTGEKNCDRDNSECVENEKRKLYEEGLFQAIGFKEFHSYFTYDGTDTEEKENLLKDGLEALKRRTIKYSKKQKTWVRNRFLSRPLDNAPDVYKLDATDLNTWQQEVLGKALDIANAFIDNVEIPFAPLERITDDIATSKHRKHVCEICNERIIIGDECWEQHLISRKHRRMKSNKNKKYDDT